MGLRQLISTAVAAAGLGALVAGIWMIYAPAAFIVGGAVLAATGLFVIDDGSPRRRGR